MWSWMRHGLGRARSGAERVEGYVGDVAQRPSVTGSARYAQNAGSEAWKGVKRTAAMGAAGELLTILATGAEHFHLGGLSTGLPSPWSELAVFAGGNILAAIPTGISALFILPHLRDSAEGVAGTVHNALAEPIQDAANKLPRRS